MSILKEGQTMKKLKKKKMVVAIIVALIGASATVAAAMIGKEKISNICINNNGGDVINAGDNSDITINKIQLDETIEDDDERERPYTVRETYIGEQSGEPGVEYNLVCVDTRLEGWCYVTYYTYDVTYY